MIVLEERKQGTIKILSQIGKDTAITEQQIKVVKAQLDRISRLKKVGQIAVYHLLMIILIFELVWFLKELNKKLCREVNCFAKPRAIKAIKQL